MSNITTKRIFDVSASLTLMVACSPLIFLGYAAVRLSDGGDGFFTQERQGLNGKPFNIYKLRTMTSHTDENKVTQYRVTKVGAYLRRKSFDELPQLLNVLRGDMSMVGPRPRIHNLDGFQKDSWFAKEKLNPDSPILSVKPGLTGPYQIASANLTNDQIFPLEEKNRLEMEYAKSPDNLKRDFKLCLATVSVVLWGKRDNSVSEHAQNKLSR